MWQLIADRLLSRVPERRRPLAAKALALAPIAFLLVWEALAIWRGSSIVVGVLVPLWEAGAERFAANFQGSPAVIFAQITTMAVVFGVQIWLVLFLWRKFRRWRQRGSRRDTYRKLYEPR